MAEANGGSMELWLEKTVVARLMRKGRGRGGIGGDTCSSTGMVRSGICAGMAIKVVCECVEGCAGSVVGDERVGHGVSKGVRKAGAKGGAL